MPSINYNYTISTQFPNGRVAPDRLQQEIVVSPGIAVKIDHIDTSADTCSIWFQSALSGAEVTALNGIVATHSGNPLFAQRVVLQKGRRTPAGLGLEFLQFSVPTGTAAIIEMTVIAKNSTNTKVAAWKMATGCLRGAAGATLSAISTSLTVKTDATWGNPVIAIDAGFNFMINFIMPTIALDAVDWDITVNITPLTP